MLGDQETPRNAKKRQETSRFVLFFFLLSAMQKIRRSAAAGAPPIIAHAPAPRVTGPISLAYKPVPAQIHDLWRPFLNEMFATMAFLTFPLLVVSAFPAFDQPGLGVKKIVVALAFGFSATAIGFGSGSLWEGHFNPAISVGLWTVGLMTTVRMIGYVVAQFLGALAIGGLIRAFTPASFDASCYGITVPGVGVAQWQAFFLELMFTFCLLWVFMAVIDAAKQGKAVGPIEVGAAIMVAHLAGVGLTGPSINPARTVASLVAAIGLSTCQQSWRYIWIYLVGPTVGGILACWVYRILFVPFDRRVLLLDNVIEIPDKVTAPPDAALLPASQVGAITTQVEAIPSQVEAA
eukprot:TRINITY_DN3069_c0_g1_i7.p1 TRINITY_DN3069_c0_g1~~TRINITY_DN3069_c0_g1_i7.p1  ORF type:complete len:349 (-),score=62.62 TRINITY_DN3069_c0_g1_i7:6-1052(-)